MSSPFSDGSGAFQRSFRDMLDAAHAQLHASGFDAPGRSVDDSGSDSDTDLIESLTTESRRRRTRLGLALSLLASQTQRAKRVRLPPVVLDRQDWHAYRAEKTESGANFAQLARTDHRRCLSLMINVLRFFVLRHIQSVNAHVR